MSTNEWDAYADGWDDDEVVRSYSTAALGSLVEVLDANDKTLDGMAVLDLGCGTGVLTEELVAGGSTVHAVDSSPAMLAVLQRKIDERGWTSVRLSKELPDQLRAFVLIVCSSVCSFLDDYPATVRQLVSLLRPGGLFVQWDWKLDEDDPEPHGLRRTDVRKALEDAGISEPVVDTAFEVPMGEHVMRPLIGYGST